MVMTDLLVPQRDIGKLPVISAEAYQHLGRFSGALILSCFEQMGGLPRMVAWADQNPTDFFTKLLPKVILRSTAVDVSGTITIDDAIARLDAIDGEYEEVQPTYDL